MVLIQRELFPNFFVGDESPPVIQGILNISPESFYKGSYVGKDEISRISNDFINNGAKILDLGARSTAPGVIPISQEEELARIKLYLEKITNLIPEGVALSIDTMYSKIASYCIDECQRNNVNIIINDVSGLKEDPKMIDLIVEKEVPFILMATNQKPGDILTIDNTLESFFQSIITLEEKNYDLNKLIIDPAIGKWVPAKTYEYDLSSIDNLERFRVFMSPILAGISRKSFIGTVLNKKDPVDRFNGTLAATSIAVYNGAHIIRTHDVNPELVEMIRMASFIRKRPLIVENNGVKGGLITGIKNPTEARYYLRREICVTPAGSRIMDKKMVTKLILLENCTAPQSMILKQELLARGGDVAIHKDAITTENVKYDKNQKLVLIGTEKQLYSLVEKLKGQQLELDKISKIIKEILEKSKEDKYLHTRVLK